MFSKLSFSHYTANHFFMRLLMIAILFLFSFSIKAGSIEFDDSIVITSKDGTKIAANLFSPNSDSQSRPAIILINSWSLEEHQYVLIARQFAMQGYEVLSYSTRGWGRSGGYVEVGSISDIEDFTAVVDWLIKRPMVDPNKIGAAGISYGGGIALIAMAFEPRLKTVVSMSGWTDLVQAVYPGQTLNQFWMSLLLGSGAITGRLSPEIPEMLEILIHGKNIERFENWANKRSAKSYLKQINHNKIPALIIQNWNDGLFPPTSIIKFYQMLEAPKKLILEEGIHGSGEATGLIGSKKNKAWTATTAWFNYWLKDIKNSASEITEVSIQVRQTSHFENYRDWPPAQIIKQNFFLSSKSNFQSGKMSNLSQQEISFDSLATGIDSKATTGIPLLSSLFDAHLGQAPSALFFEINPVHSFKFLSSKLTEKMKIRGSPTLNLFLQSACDQQTVIAYLYEIDRLGIARLITYGVNSIGAKDHVQNTLLNWEMIPTAFDIPLGHRFGLVIDTKDPIFRSIGCYLSELRINYSGAQQNILTVPML